MMKMFSQNSLAASSAMRVLPCSLAEESACHRVMVSSGVYETPGSNTKHFVPEGSADGVNGVFASFSLVF